MTSLLCFFPYLEGLDSITTFMLLQHVEVAAGGASDHQRLALRRVAERLPFRRTDVQPESALAARHGWPAGYLSTQ